MALVEVEQSYLNRLQWKITHQASIIQDLQKELEQVTETKDNCQFIIRTELEPRIEQEKRSYDAWVSTNTGERECENFYDTIDGLEDFVKENKNNFEWEEAEGDLYAMILYLIKNREDVESGYYYIEEYGD